MPSGGWRLSSFLYGKEEGTENEKTRKNGSIFNLNRPQQNSRHTSITISYTKDHTNSHNHTHIQGASPGATCAHASASLFFFLSSRPANMSDGPPPVIKGPPTAAPPPTTKTTATTPACSIPPPLLHLAQDVNCLLFAHLPVVDLLSLAQTCVVANENVSHLSTL